MDRGKKKQTLTSGERSKYSSSVNASVPARNLPQKQLGVVILGCTHKTMKECLAKQLFGLPACHYSYVKKIQSGMPLFLFNYSDRKLHGVFKARSHGQMNINPRGWTGNVLDITPYPAQVQVCVWMHCQGLAEERYKEIIKANYSSNSHPFSFELDQSQAGQLIALFQSMRLSSPVAAYPRNMHTGRTLHGLLPCSDTRSRNEETKPLPMEDVRCSEYKQPVSPETGFKWANLFKGDSKLGERVENASISESDISGFNHSITEPETSDGTSCLNEDSTLWVTELVTDEEETKGEQVLENFQQLPVERDHSNSHRRDHIEDVSCPGDWENQFYPDASEALMKKYVEESIHSYGHQSANDQVRQDMDDIKALLREQICKMDAMEKKQAEDIQELKDRDANKDKEIQELKDCLVILEAPGRFLSTLLWIKQRVKVSIFLT